MAQHVVPGRNAKMFVTADAGMTWHQVRGVKRFVVNCQTTDGDTSDFDDGGEKHFQPMLGSITIDIEGNFIDEDAGQLILEMSGDDGVQIGFDWSSGAGANLLSYRGAGHIRSKAKTAANKDPAKMTFVFLGSTKPPSAEYDELFPGAEPPEPEDPLNPNFDNAENTAEDGFEFANGWPDAIDFVEFPDFDNAENVGDEDFDDGGWPGT